MGKKLIAYQISGQTVGVDIQNWNKNDLNGNPPFTYVIDDATIPNNYVDINSIKYWHDYGYEFANDYSVIRFGIKDIVDNVGWGNLTNNEKDLAIEYYAYPDPTTAAIYLMENMSQEQTQQFLTKTWHKHHLKNIEAYKQRWDYTKYTVLQYLSRSDGEDLFNTVKPLIDTYVEIGIIGRDFGDNNDGVIDYIYSINGFTGQGLVENNYNLLQGTWDDFKMGVFNVLVNGIYEKY